MGMGRAASPTAPPWCHKSSLLVTNVHRGGEQNRLSTLTRKMQLIYPIFGIKIYYFETEIAPGSAASSPEGD